MYAAPPSARPGPAVAQRSPVSNPSPIRTDDRIFAVTAVALTLLAALAIVATSPNARAGTPPTGFADTLVTAGLSTPMSLVFLPDASGRAVIVQQAGAIRAWDGVTLSTLHTMVEVVSGGERGLLGVEIDPDWPARPYLYVYYTANVGFVQVARFELTDPGGVLTLNPASKLILIDDMPDIAGNHNGGTLRFAPDKTLYMSVGDDASGCQAQDLTVLAGKILRIRVDDSIDPLNRATLAPPDNPFFNSPSDNAKLVWGYGLRNPFRFDIDPSNSDVFIGDVGQSAWEEVSLGDAGGINFGWPYYEGFVPYQLALCPGDTSIPTNHDPIYVYPNPGAGSASVIGASLYRGVDYPVDDSFPPAYDHDFFFMDFYAGFLRVLRYNPSSGGYDLVAGVSATDWGTAYAFVPDIVEGPDGALYFLTGTSLRRIAYVAAVPPQPTGLTATLVNGLNDVLLTWTVPSPETGVDHYEVWWSLVYDPYRDGYTQASPDLPLGSAVWADLGVGALPRAYFYFVQAVAIGGETAPSPGQVAKFTRPVLALPTLLSTSVTTASSLVTANVQGTATWSIARTFDASDAADSWKRFVAARPGNDLVAVDRTHGVWVDVTAAGDFRIAGFAPCSTTLDLRAGWNLVGFPSMTFRTVAAATAGLAGPLIVEGYSSSAAEYHLLRLGPTSILSPTEAYWIYSPMDQPWTVENDARPSCV